MLAEGPRDPSPGGLLSFLIALRDLIALRGLIAPRDLIALGDKADDQK